MKRTNWTREELILALHLYFQLPFGQISHKNERVIALSHILERTPSAVSFKLFNFSSIDPYHKNRGVSGFKNIGKLDEVIWSEYSSDWGRLSIEAEEILAAIENKPLEETQIIEFEGIKEGKEKLSLIKTRINQSFFREAILACYNQQCAITGLPIKELLVASHIIPWAKDEQNRLNPTNGICLNALHDRAFDKGLMTITPDYKIKISKYVLDFEENKSVMDSLLSFDNKGMQMPSKFYPSKEFLEYHNNTVFVK